MVQKSFGSVLPLTTLIFFGCESKDTISLNPEDYPFRFVPREIESKVGKEIQFVDLDNDGTDERILLSHGMKPNESLILVTTDSGKVINQKNLVPTTSCLFGFAADMNRDGKRDLFFVTTENDTLFTNVVDIYRSVTLHRFSVFPKPPGLKSLPQDVGSFSCRFDGI